MSKPRRTYIKITACAMVALLLAHEAVLAAPAMPGAGAVMSARETARSTTPERRALDIAEFLSDPSSLDLPLRNSVVREIHRGTNGRLIIHFQDAHANLSGQKNLAESLEYMMDRYDLPLVLVEGASRDVTLDQLKSLPENWPEAAKKWLYDGLISGEEYVNLSSDRPMRIVGVEDADLYASNLEAYANLARARSGVEPSLRAARAALERIKARLYPRELLDVDRADRNGSEFLKRVETLRRFANGASPGEFEELHKFEDLREVQARIDFNRVNAEWAEFHKQGGTDASAFKELTGYQEYTRRFADLDMDALLAEIDSLERRAYERLLDEPNARTLHAVDRFVALLEDGYKIHLSSRDYAALVETGLPATESWQAFVNGELARLGYYADFLEVDKALDGSRKLLNDFYSIVDRRDEAFVRNAKRVMDERGAACAFLVAGGYHTEHLTQLWRDEGTSYIVLAPNVTYETDTARYEKLLLAQLQDGSKDTLRAAALLEGELGLARAHALYPAGDLPGISNDPTVWAALNTFPRLPVGSRTGAELFEDNFGKASNDVLKFLMGRPAQTNEIEIFSLNRFHKSVSLPHDSTTRKTYAPELKLHGEGDPIKIYIKRHDPPSQSLNDKLRGEAEFQHKVWQNDAAVDARAFETDLGVQLVQAEALGDPWTPLWPPHREAKVLEAIAGALGRMHRVGSHGDLQKLYFLFERNLTDHIKGGHLRINILPNGTVEVKFIDFGNHGLDTIEDEAELVLENLVDLRFYGIKPEKKSVKQFKNQLREIYEKELKGAGSRTEAQRRFVETFGSEAEEVLRFVTGLEDANLDNIDHFSDPLEIRNERENDSDTHRVTYRDELGLSGRHLFVYFYHKILTPSSDATNSRLRAELEIQNQVAGEDAAVPAKVFMVDGVAYLVQSAYGRPMDFRDPEMTRREVLYEVARTIARMHRVARHNDLDIYGDHIRFKESANSVMDIRIIDFGSSSWIQHGVSITEPNSEALEIINALSRAYTQDHADKNDDGALQRIRAELTEVYLRELNARTGSGSRGAGLLELPGQRMSGAEPVAGSRAEAQRRFVETFGSEALEVLRFVSGSPEINLDAIKSFETPEEVRKKTQEIGAEEDAPEEVTRITRRYVLALDSRDEPIVFFDKTMTPSSEKTESLLGRERDIQNAVVREDAAVPAKIFKINNDAHLIQPDAGDKWDWSNSNLMSVEVLYEVVRAIARMHRVALHIDLSVDHIRFRFMPGGNVKVRFIDYGAARWLDGLSESPAGRTEFGATMVRLWTEYVAAHSGDANDEIKKRFIQALEDVDSVYLEELNANENAGSRGAGLVGLPGQRVGVDGNEADVRTAAENLALVGRVGSFALGVGARENEYVRFDLAKVGSRNWSVRDAYAAGTTEASAIQISEADIRLARRQRALERVGPTGAASPFLDDTALDAIREGLAALDAARDPSVTPDPAEVIISLRLFAGAPDSLDAHLEMLRQTQEFFTAAQDRYGEVVLSFRGSDENILVLKAKMESLRVAMESALRSGDAARAEELERLKGFAARVLLRTVSESELPAAPGGTAGFVMDALDVSQGIDAQARASFADGSKSMTPARRPESGEYLNLPALVLNNVALQRSVELSSTGLRTVKAGALEGGSPLWRQLRTLFGPEITRADGATLVVPNGLPQTISRWKLFAARPMRVLERLDGWMRGLAALLQSA